MNVFSLKNTPLYAESWNVAFREKPAGTILQDTQTPFTVIRNSFRYWAADPFIIEQAGKVYIFAELYDYILRRGVLGFCELADGKAAKWQPIIREDYHLSYPCLMESERKLYLMPESGEGEVLAVYEATHFPDRWEKRTVLRDNVKFADTTPIPCKSKHWALTHQVNDPEHPLLTLIDLDGQLGDTPVSDAVPLRSRPAGHFFENDGKQIRPAQLSLDTGAGYGKGLVFCECQLDESFSYNEKEINVIFPEDLKYDTPIFLDGMHTYNASQHYEVIDIKTRRFNILNFVMRIAGKFLRN